MEMKKLLSYNSLLPCFFLAIINLVSCQDGMVSDSVTNKADDSTNQGYSIEFVMSKVWAHEVDDTNTAKIKQKLFDGLELNLNYSEYQNQIFIGHELYDTAKNVTLETWFSALDNPQKNCYWLDCKNISPQNAEAFLAIIKTVAQKHHVTDKIFIESRNPHVIKIVNNAHLKTILWVENFHYWQTYDTLSWYKTVKKDIEKANPYAISCEYTMFPILTDSFPNMNVHFWNTPAAKNPESVKRTIDMCRTPNVKVVLVDFDEPIAY